MTITQRFTRRATLGLALLVLPACGNLGSLGQVLGGLGGLGGVGGQQGGGEVRGEVTNVDTRRQEIEIRTQNGQNARVMFDNRTEVIYQNQRYAVTNLERGDVVLLRVQQGSRGEYYTDRIFVEQNVRDRQGGGYGDSGAQVQLFDGRVGRVDSQRGHFEFQARNGGTYTVTMPYNPGSADLDRFRRLRSGDGVRFEGSLVNRERIELYRFR